jgi:hypothetical protein
MKLCHNKKFGCQKYSIMFPHLKFHIYSLTSPDLKAQHQINHVLTSMPDVRSFRTLYRIYIMYN